MHAFAHNGTLKGIEQAHKNDQLTYTPLGETDSEIAFCVLLEALQPLWDSAPDKAPSIEARLDVFAKFASEQRPRGSSNFLYSDGDVLFAHAHKRIHEEDGEDGEDSKARAPGLSLKSCITRDGTADYIFKGLNVGQVHQQTTVPASVPLDTEGWEPLPEGVAIAIQAGVEVGRISTDS